MQAVWSGGFLLFENRHNFIINGKGVGSLRLCDGNDGGRIAVEDGFGVFGIETLRNGRDVFQPQFGTGFGGNDNDVAKIFRRLAAVIEP